MKHQERTIKNVPSRTLSSPIIAPPTPHSPPLTLPSNDQRTSWRASAKKRYQPHPTPPHPKHWRTWYKMHTNALCLWEVRSKSARLRDDRATNKKTSNEIWHQKHMIFVTDTCRPMPLYPKTKNDAVQWIEFRVSSQIRVRIVPFFFNGNPVLTTLSCITSSLSVWSNTWWKQWFICILCGPRGKAQQTIQYTFQILIAETLKVLMNSDKHRYFRP